MKIQNGLIFLLLCNLTAFADNQNLNYTKYAERAKAIVSTMTLQEKIGQMTLPCLEFVMQEGGLQIIHKTELGGVLVGGNTTPPNGLLLEHWQELAKNINDNAPKIPLLLGTDAVHGNQHIEGAVIFPHNIGLGATHDEELIQQIATWTAYDVKQSGFNWVYAPTVAAVHDYRWGRTYESFSNDPALVKALSTQYILGAQAILHDKITGVLTSTKHFIGDGNTDEGLDEGNASIIDLTRFLEENYPGFEGAFSASTGNVMISYSSIDQRPMSLNKDFLQQYLFPNFTGFVVSDYEAIDKAALTLHQSYRETLAEAINGGIDMVMFGSDYPYFYQSIEDFQRILLDDVNNGSINLSRIDEAVTRILQVKIAMGLLDNKKPILKKPNQDENTIALQAAEESLVLLKNKTNTEKTVLPLNIQKMKNIILLGDQGYQYNQQGLPEPNGIYKFDDIGSQCGGWTIDWQGYEGNQYAGQNATSVLTGIKNILGNNTHYLQNPDDLDTELNNPMYTTQNTVAIAVIAEFPYAEFMGDIGNHNPLYYFRLNPFAPPNQLSDLVINYDEKTLERIKALKKANIPVITVLLSGRPMIINASADAPLNLSDAFIAAWLPGTTGGQAIANALFGLYHFGEKENANTLPLAWPASMAQLGHLSCLPNHNQENIPLFACNAGLKD